MLTKQQEAFAVEVANGSTYSDAYRKAYPACRKWQIKSVWEKSSELMSHGKVLARVKELQAPAEEEAKLTIKGILMQIKYWVEFDPQILVDDDGCFKSFSDIPAKDRKCIDSFEIKETWDKDGRKSGRIVKIKTPEKKGTMDMINKMLGSYIKDNMQKSATEITDEMREMLNEIDGIEL